MQLKLKKNGNGNGHTNGNGNNSAFKQVLLVVAVLLVGFLAYRMALRLSGPPQQVWVARNALPAGSVVGAGDLEAVTRRGRRVPEGAVTDRRQIEGRRLARPLAAGEPFVGGALTRSQSAQQRAQSLTELLPPGRVLTRVLIDIDSVLMHELEFGDRFEIVASGGSGGPEEPASRVVASDAFFFAWVDPALLAGNGGGGNGNGSQPQQSGLLASLLATPGLEGGGGPRATSSTKLMVALRPEDALPVTEAAATGASLSMVLHGRREVTEGRILTLPTSRPVIVELIDGSRREKVPFVRGRRPCRAGVSESWGPWRFSSRRPPSRKSPLKRNCRRSARPRR